MAQPDRDGGSGLSLRTLAIASAASLTAALVTSRLFPPGTIYASALTPVIVAAVSEFLSRPVDRVTELRRRRTMVLEAARAPLGEEGSALRDAGFGYVEDEPATLATNGTGERGPIRIHGRSRRRLLHPKVWLATGAVAFVVAAALLTLPELIFGGAVANKHRTTFFGGGSAATKTETTKTTTETETQPEEKTVTETAPAQTPPATETTPTETQTTPTETQPAPSDTGSTTTTTPTETVPIP